MDPYKAPYKPQSSYNKSKTIKEGPGSGKKP